MLAVVAAVVAGAGAVGAVLLTGGGSDGDDDLDTATAAETLATSIDPDAEDEAPFDCPLDDVDDHLADAVAPLDEDELYDLIDTGQERSYHNVSSERVRGLCVRFTEPLGPGLNPIGISLAETPDDIERFLESDEPSTEISELGEFRGGVIYLTTTTAEFETVAIAWVDDNVVLSLVIGGEASTDLDEDDLRGGFEDVLPDLVDELDGTD